jgi:rhodanese-related sulfurtransferase
MSIPEIEADEAARLAGDGAHLLDVREPAEWQSGHAPGALWIPLGHLSTRFHELPTDRRIAVVCRSGGRSAMATEGARRPGARRGERGGWDAGWAAEVCRGDRRRAPERSEPVSSGSQGTRPLWLQWLRRLAGSSVRRARRRAGLCVVVTSALAGLPARRTTPVPRPPARGHRTGSGFGRCGPR